MGIFAHLLHDSDNIESAAKIIDQKNDVEKALTHKITACLSTSTFWIKTIFKSLLIFVGTILIAIILDMVFLISESMKNFAILAYSAAFLFTGINIGIAFKKRTPQKTIQLPSQTAELIYQSRQAKAQVPVNTAPQKKSIMEIVDAMEGHEFEYWCAELLKDCGYQEVHVTRGSGDQGVDVIATKHGMRYAFQCKRYSGKLGNSAIQQVNTGKMVYSCMKAVVITNSYFTSGAKHAAKATGVELWDRDVLMDKISRIAKRERSSP